MAAPAREMSLDFHLLERMKFSGMDRENLNDLVSILVSLKNKFGITPFAVAALGIPAAPDKIVARYLMESITLNKLMNILLDTPRLHAVTVVPRGIPKSTQFEVKLTIGG